MIFLPFFLLKPLWCSQLIVNKACVVYRIFLYLGCKLRKNKLKFEIMEGYCVKCKAKKEIKDAAEVTMKNGRKAMKGKCPSCGTGMFRILGKA